ncbi:hypothetical protein ASF69_04740 [Rhizobium sp. Leaf311]|uniref:hypothetical protein n=1 Tax=Rhizobium sp. Leaf311 TaxID=1736332 RepID=UPI0007156613|nr:hypothetical protein [Rhizobium sp. Leaf311]KQQ46538.1 hypothetical protein ASF69_04740 [Rhizobium sp. Leaf311]
MAGELTSLSLSQGLGIVGQAPPAPVMAVRLAHRIYGPGYNGGAAPSANDGTEKTFTTPSYANESGAPITVCSVAFQGWVLRTTGTADTSAPYAVAGNIEYPVGTVVGSYTATVSPGQATASAEVTLSTPIPAGASFRVTGAATPANGATYVTQSLGFAGLRTHAVASTLRKIALAWFGDSISTNNNGAAYNAALGRCPVYLASISGTTASTYAANSGLNFQKQIALCQLLGITDIATNYGTNDFGAGATFAELQGYVTTFRDMTRAIGCKYNHATMTPRTVQKAAVSISNLVSSGFFATATVPDATLFDVGQPIVVAGATQTEYNGSGLIVTAVNTGANTITYLFPGSATTPATGTITARSWKATSSAKWMDPASSKYAAGAGSDRGLFNAWVRSGALDGFIDWGDALEPTRDSGRFAVAGEKSALPVIQLVTVSSVISSSRFNSNYTGGSSTVANGFVQPLSGANQGVQRNGNGNTNGDITVSSAFPNTQVVGDQYYVVPGVSYISDDNLHPRVSSGGKGGQVLLDNETAAWIDMKNAA